MSFQTLPDDILLGILQHASWTKHYRENFKQQLHILGIFQRLRAIALPKIYNNMYIDYDEEAYKRETHVKEYSKPFTGYIHTNADIIALANCAHMVITAKLTLKCLSVTCDELHNTLGALQGCATTWPNINKLELYMSYNAYSCTTGEAHSTLFPRMCKKYSQKLANIMPGVTELLLVNWYINISICEFYGNVADAYANQLVKLTSKHGFDFTGRHKYEAMQYLYINMSRNKSLPSVNSHTLVDLHIGDISFNVSWTPFMIKVDAVIDFLCLKKLSLEFNCRENTEENMPDLLLNFPKLSSLTIVCHAARCPFFEMAKFPDKMNVINIKGPQTLLAQLKDAGMPTAKTLTMRS